MKKTDNTTYLARPKGKPAETLKGKLNTWANGYAEFVPQGQMPSNRTMLRQLGNSSFYKSEGEKESSYSLHLNVDGKSEDPVAEIPVAYDILQAVGVRVSQAEYIACPSCGRTQYNIEEALHRIKTRTSHLKGVKIGVMGCIVNGPGEMADADYGYVGSGAGKITLYKGREVVRRNVDQADAVEELVNLIKANGDWVDA